MIGMCKSRNRNNLVALKGRRPMGVELLDSRLMMTASPLFDLDAVAAAVHEAPPEVEVPGTCPIAEVADTPPLLREAVFPGGGGSLPEPRG